MHVGGQAVEVVAGGPPTERAHWDDVLAEILRGEPLDVWRLHMAAIYRGLIVAWSPPGGGSTGLKTDLFEEAISPHHPFSDLPHGSLGIDLSPAVVRAARDRLRGENRDYRFLVGDLRRLPLRSGAVQTILSGSSIDHFRDRRELDAALLELTRVLSPGGTLILTLDNPQNPVVWIRNRLPFSLLKRLGLPYFVGATCSLREARRRLEEAGLTVTHMTTAVHAPRAPAIWVTRQAERMRWLFVQRALRSLLESCEVMRRWPTSLRTGYYIALRAEKPSRRLNTRQVIRERGRR